jgi:hypothetical protein
VKVLTVLHFCLVVVLCDPTVSRNALAQDKPPAAERKNDKSRESSLDDALLKDLDNELLEGAGDLRPRPKTTPAPKKDASQSPAEEMPSEPDAAGEDVGAPGEAADPLVRVSDQMRSVERLLTKANERKRTEQLQRSVVDDLAALIEQLEKRAAQQAQESSSKKSQKTGQRQTVQQPKSQGNRKNQGASSPAQDSSERLGKAEEVPPDPALQRGLMKDAWGHLPERAREQMLQNPPERFLPQYELMIERYYRRLAEEQGSK